MARRPQAAAWPSGFARTLRVIENDTESFPRDPGGIPSAHDPVNEKKTRRANAALLGPRCLSARSDLLALSGAIILQQRVLLGACALFGLVATYEAAHCCADYAVMASVMADNAANDCAL